MRICSLLPGATEIAYLLGLGDQVVGVTHECDYPSEAKQKSLVVQSVIDPNRMSSQEIDRKVGELLQAGKGLYSIATDAFLAAAPDLILTQGLCDVCALDYDEVVKAARLLPRMPAILSLNPHSLFDVLEDIARVGAATGRERALPTRWSAICAGASMVSGSANRNIARAWSVSNGSSRSTLPATGCLRWSRLPEASIRWAARANHRSRSNGKTFSMQSQT